MATTNGVTAAQELRRRQLDSYLERKYGTAERPKSVIANRMAKSVLGDRNGVEPQTPLLGKARQAARPATVGNVDRSLSAREPHTPRSIALAEWQKSRASASKVTEATPGRHGTNQRNAHDAFQERLNTFAARRKTPATTRVERVSVRSDATDDVSRALVFGSPPRARPHTFSLDDDVEEVGEQRANASSERTSAEAKKAATGAQQRAAVCVNKARFNAFQGDNSDSPWRKHLAVSVNKKGSVTPARTSVADRTEHLERMMLAEIQQARENVKSGRYHSARLSLARMIHRTEPVRNIALHSTLYWLARVEAEQAGREVLDSAKTVLVLFETAAQCRAEPKAALIRALQSFQVRVAKEKRRQKELLLAQQNAAADEEAENDPPVAGSAERELCAGIDSLTIGEAASKDATTEGTSSERCAASGALPDEAVRGLCNAVTSAVAQHCSEAPSSSTTSCDSMETESDEPMEAENKDPRTPPPVNKRIARVSGAPGEMLGKGPRITTPSRFPSPCASPVRINSPLFRRPARRVARVSQTTSESAPAGASPAVVRAGLQMTGLNTPERVRRTVVRTPEQAREKSLPSLITTSSPAETAALEEVSQAMPKFSLLPSLPRDFPREVLENAVRSTPSKKAKAERAQEDEQASFVLLAPLPVRGKERDELGSDVKLTPVRRSHRLERSTKKKAAQESATGAERQGSLGSLLQGTSYTYVPNAAVDHNSVYFGTPKAKPSFFSEPITVEDSDEEEDAPSEETEETEAEETMEEEESESGATSASVKTENAAEASTPPSARLAPAAAGDNMSVRRSARLQSRHRKV